MGSKARARLAVTLIAGGMAVPVIGIAPAFATGSDATPVPHTSTASGSPSVGSGSASGSPSVHPSSGSGSPSSGSGSPSVHPSSGSGSPSSGSGSPSVHPSSSGSSTPVESIGASVGGITFTQSPAPSSSAPSSSTGVTVTPTRTNTADGGVASVLGETFTKDDAGTTLADPADPSALPFTGIELGALVTTSLALIGGGTVLMVTARRRRGVHTS